MMKNKSVAKSLTAINFLLLAIIFLLIFSPFFHIDNTLDSVLTMLLAFIFMLIHGYLSLGTA